MIVSPEMDSKIKGENRPEHPRESADPEGAALWSLATRDVKPVRKSRTHIAKEATDKKQKTKTQTHQTLSSKAPSRTVFRRLTPQNPGPTPPPPRKTASDPSVPSCAPRGRRRRTFEVEARLDLHGHTRARAHSVLIRFLERAHAEGKRDLLIITGKGRNRTDGLEEGVLRRHVPEWLKMPPLRDIILETSSAHPRDGGTGALYVRLRKKPRP